MKNSELINYLYQFPLDIDIRLLQNLNPKEAIVELEFDNILYTSESAYINHDAPEEDWDTEYGKIELGDGKQYLLFNPIIV